MRLRYNFCFMPFQLYSDDFDNLKLKSSNNYMMEGGL